MVEIVIIKPLFLLTFTFNDWGGARLGYFYPKLCEKSHLLCEGEDAQF